MTRPLVSIVTTSYEHAPYLEETLRSVLEQDYPRIEYLVVDDGSTDASPEIVRRYADRLAWWACQENEGQVAALNRAFSHATGDLLGFVNSDDTLLPGAISQVAEAFAREPDLVAVYGDVYLTNERSERLEYGVAGPWDMARMAKTVYTPHQPSTFWSRRAWEAAGPFNERAWALFDVEFNLRAGLLGEVRYLRVPLATFRLHPESKSLSRHRRMAEECLRFSKEFFESPDLPPQLRPYARAARATLYRRAALHHQADGDLAQARRLFLGSLVLSRYGLTTKQLRRLARTLVPERVVRRPRKRS
jgi:glycosyltransferase involved in cell wall biosynthesis